METIGLYVHVPLLRVPKCPYCDFYSLPAGEEGMDRYTQAVIRALKDNPFGPRNAGHPLLWRRYPPFHWGPAAGGHPGGGLIPIRPPAPGAEITLKPTLLHPCGAPAGAEGSGFNRVSFRPPIGHPSQLKSWAAATAEDARTAVEDAFRAGFQNVSLDLMLGIPTADGGRCGNFHPVLRRYRGTAHLGLPFEDRAGHPFAARYREEDFDPDLQADIYLRAVDRLESLGYRQYEDLQLRPPRVRSRHNLKYWLLEPYLGVSLRPIPAWTSRRFYFPGMWNPFRLLHPLFPGGRRRARRLLEEYLMLRLRLTQGVSLRRHKSATPV